MAGAIIDQGRVIAVVGDEVLVTIETGEACERCGARILCSPGGDKNRNLKAKNQIGAAVGDRVTVEESGNLLLKLSALQYGLPLTGFLTGVFTVYLLAPRVGELLIFGCGLLGLALTGLISWRLVKYMAERSRNFFLATRIVN